jgi:hypothetical protein
MSTKQELIDEICDHLKIRRFVVSRGSTEPREFFVAVIEQLGIQSLSDSLDKPGLGRLIVEAGGRAWLPSFDSNGGTVTRHGLEAIQETVQRLVRAV